MSYFSIEAHTLGVQPFLFFHRHSVAWITTLLSFSLTIRLFFQNRNKIKSKKFELTVKGDKIILKTIKKKIEEYYGVVKVDRHLTVEEIEEKARELTAKAVRGEL